MDCGSCKYWKEADSLSPDGRAVGECIRFPRQATSDNKWLYSLQFESDICGEHKSRQHG